MVMLSHRWNSGFRVDNMTENLIIMSGQAIPSGSGPDVAVAGPFKPSGDSYAFTNRLSAPGGRICNTVAQPSVSVTILPQTRRDEISVPRSNGAAALVYAYQEVSSREFPNHFTQNQSGAGFVALFSEELRINNNIHFPFKGEKE